MLPAVPKEVAKLKTEETALRILPFHFLSCQRDQSRFWRLCILSEIKAFSRSEEIPNIWTDQYPARGSAKSEHVEISVGAEKGETHGDGLNFICWLWVCPFGPSGSWARGHTGTQPGDTWFCSSPRMSTTKLGHENVSYDFLWKT